jgi:uncharacterized protein (DUF433 family)
MTLSAAIEFDAGPQSTDDVVSWDAFAHATPSSDTDNTGSHPALTKVIRVTRKPDVMGGMHVIAGTRVPAYWVYDMFQEVGSISAVQHEYPHLETDDILAVLSFALLNPHIIEADREEHRRETDPFTET